ncbi:hypothetical protein CBS63078_4860 [Aspergillus niger]|nr:hypothetical protein CBS63078_4860 [Aspergillus niger]KAI2919462.1 hypothetical protein CBS147320_8589 [Aspergillus niger]KAI2936830.1 hypothetical protein CBS147321_8287 [Aspergillus niger]
MARVVRGEGDSLQKRGQLLFRQGNYSDALAAFTEALSCKGADVMSILDNRAATYIKLTQYDRALNDSRQMIRRDTKDGRGVLRYGQTLLLTGDRAKALKAYGYGLKTLPEDHPRRKMILQMYCKVKERASVKRLDPFDTLPLELAMMVLQHFNFRELAVLLRVSKGWQRMLSQPDLWMHLDFTEARRKVHWRSFRAFVQRSRALLTHAVMTNISTPFQDRVLEALSRCPKLEHLEIRDPITQPNGLYDVFRSSTQLKSLVIGKQTPVAQENIAKFLSSLTQLELLEIHNAQPSPESRVHWPSHLPNLRSIALFTEASMPAPGRVPALYIPPATESMSCSMPNLEELRLDSYPKVWAPYNLSFDPVQFPRLRKLDLKGVFVGPFGLPPSLEYLSIHAGAAPTGEEFPFSPEQLLHLPSLHTLILRDLIWVTYRTLHGFIVDSKASLRNLVVDRCPQLDTGKLSLVLVENSVNLTELGVPQLPGINDSTVKTLVEGLSNLTALDVSNTDVTGYLLKMLADARSSNVDFPRVEYVLDIRIWRPIESVFTGATDGIGKATLTRLISTNLPVRVYVIGRNGKRHQAFLDELRLSNRQAQITWLEGQLSLLADTKKLCDEIKRRETSLDCLYLSAGFISSGERIETSEGKSLSLSLNYYSRILMMTLLLPLLNSSPNSPRIVSILNAGYESSSIYLDDLDLEKPGHFSLLSLTKSMSTYTTLSMSTLAQENPHVVFVHHYPGGVTTDAFKKAWGGKWYFPLFRAALSAFGTSPEDAAEKVLYLITSARYGGRGVALGEGQKAGMTMAKSVKGGELFAIDNKMKELFQGKVMLELQAMNAGEIVWRKTVETLAPYSS